jgi:molybdate/tungstate transport system ATP-binding protein
VTARAAAVQELSLRLGGFALNHLDFSVDPGEILVMLGPNGAGKSLTLETIAGFHRPDAGRIVIGGRDVTLLPPERRNVGLLFQDFGLFPHLSVARNVAVGLRTPRRRAPSRGLAELLADLGIAHLARRNPRGLSPGEKQRVALARALAAEPDLFLFDEPFSALDAQTHARLRDDLEEFLRNTGVPAIFVTHDHSDALALADRVIVVRDGAIVQSGATAAIFETPVDRFVAEFVGFDNILAGHIAGRAGGLLTVAVSDRLIDVAATNMAEDCGREVWLCVRAEDIDLHPAGHAVGVGTRLTARILSVRSEGMLTRVALDCGFSLRACAMTRHVRKFGLAAEAVVEAEIAPQAIHVIPAGEPA